MDLPSLDQIEQLLGHAFRDRALLERALTHSSALAKANGAGAASVRPHVADNEPLEYLGDAVLGLIVSERLLADYPDWGAGQLSRGRARLVNAASLFQAAHRLGLGAYLHLGRGEEKTGGRAKPALLADAFEAVVAAIYLDGGLEPARLFVNRALLSEIAARGHGLGHPDYKSELQELLQQTGAAAAQYRLAREAGPDHQKTFWIEVIVGGRVAATGTGTSKKEAEQAAAGLALEQLRPAPATPLT
jgi:ribonuclease-3